MEIKKSKKTSRGAYEITAYQAAIDEFYFYKLHKFEINRWALTDEDGECLQTFSTKKSAIDWIYA